VVSDTLRNSRLLKPARTEASPREAVILVSLINHPALAESRLEALAGLDFGTPAGRKLFSAILDLIMGDHDIVAGDLRAALGARGFGPDIERMESMLRAQGVWQVMADAAQLDAETGLRHALALHYKSVELNKALKAAENALDVDWTEDSFRVLQDIKNQITTVDGTEALIEGFGSLSGRAARSF
jgi:DNA primase